MTVAVIIPTYNEAGRIEKVLAEVVKSSLVNEIIVVDDGSTDGTRESLKNIAGIKVINNQKNLGKTASLKEGFINSYSEIVVFIDADLTNFKVKHLDSLIRKAMEGYDMVLGGRGKELLVTRFLGAALAFTGERAVKRERLDEHMEVFDEIGYVFEPALNKVAFGHWKVSKVIMDDVGQIYKVYKTGPIGLWRELQVYKKYFDYLGLKDGLFQLKFCRNL